MGNSLVPNGLSSGCRILGPYGSKSWTYDGVGNRTLFFALRMPIRIRAIETNAGVLDTYNYPTTSNRLQSVTRVGVTPNPRGFTAACPREGGERRRQYRHRRALGRVLCLHVQ